MSQYKEFEGKTLDDAIKEACEYYGVIREKLEIDILSDAKGGIFGLVGMKKARIRASRVQLNDAVSSLLDDNDAPARRAGGQREAQPRGGGAKKEAGRENAEKGRPAKESPGAAKTARKDVQNGKSREGAAPAATGGGREGAAPRPEQAPRSEKGAAPAPAREGRGAEQRGQNGPEAAGRNSGNESGRALGQASGGGADRAKNGPGGRGKGRNGGGRTADQAAAREAEKTNAPGADAVDGAAPVREEAPEFAPEFVLEACDQEELFRVVQEVVLCLVEPIVGEVPCTVDISGRRVRAALDCGDASGLLVGRDGQTLASVQYLAARIVSRRLGGAVRLQVDAGKYRERQDDKLKELALSLAGRVRESGRPQTTRPLTAYQRRLVHLALEDDEAVQTRSKGEGAQRRVVIFLKKPEAGRQPAPEAEPCPPESSAPETEPGAALCAPALSPAPAAPAPAEEEDRPAAMPEEGAG